MNPKVQDVIAAFVDGEPVVAEDLREALCAKEGREYLIDLVALRGLVRPAAAWSVAPVAHPAARDHVTAEDKSRMPLVWTTAAAAVLAVSTLAGFSAGRMTRPVTAPESPTITVQAAPPPALSIDAPAPTRVIELKHGLDWTEQSGGN